LWEAAHVTNTSKEVAKIIGDQGRAGAAAAVSTAPVLATDGTSSSASVVKSASSPMVVVAPHASSTIATATASHTPLPPTTPHTFNTHHVQSPSFYTSPSGVGSSSEREQALLEEVYSLRKEMSFLREEISNLKMRAMLESQAWAILHDATKAKNTEAYSRLLAALDELGLVSMSDLRVVSIEQAQKLSMHLKPLQATLFLQSLLFA
jgi:hypothetical protein